MGCKEGHLAEAGEIQIEGRNKLITVIQNASNRSIMQVIYDQCVSNMGKQLVFLRNGGTVEIPRQIRAEAMRPNPYRYHQRQMNIGLKNTQLF